MFFFSTLFSTTIVQDGLPRRFAPRNDGECEIGNKDATQEAQKTATSPCERLKRNWRKYITSDIITQT
jgi:hypothetical protein